MKRINKGFIILTIIFSLLLNSTVVSATAKARYMDDIFDACKITKDIPFSKVKDYKGDLITMKLDVYEPTKDTAVNRPVIVWIHGGNMQFGAKDDYKSICTKLALKGFVVVPINYRLNPNVYSDNETWVKTLRDAGIDIESAIKWIRENAEAYGIDPYNIIMGGHSSGAELVGNIYYDDFFYPEFDRTGITACIDLSGWRLFQSPIEEVSTIGNPDTKCLIIRGGNDDISPIEQGKNFAKQLGNRAVTKFIDNQDHYWRGEGEVLVVNAITEFLKDNITYQEKEKATSEEGSFFQQIKATPTECNLFLGGKKSAQIKVVLPETGESIGKVTITYECNNKVVAKVNKDGLITALERGKAVINSKVTLASGKSKYISTQITVDEAYIEISKTTSSIKKGKTFTFKATTYGLEDKDTVWSTSKKSVLMIDKKTGKATAKSQGIAYITVRNGSNFEKVKVVVK